MAMITTITRLPAAATKLQRGESVDSVAPTTLAPITDALGAPALPPDHLLLLSRKLARQSRDEALGMRGSLTDGLD